MPVLRSETITKDNLSTLDWGDETQFKYCNFEDVSPQGGHIESDFVNCAFKNVDWYGGLFNIMNFVDCLFTDCIFRGSSFAGCRFVSCSFVNCHFLKNNMASNCKFDNSFAYDSTVEGGDGFGAQIRCQREN